MFDQSDSSDDDRILQVSAHVLNLCTYKDHIDVIIYMTWQIRSRRRINVVSASPAAMSDRMSHGDHLDMEDLRSPDGMCRVSSPHPSGHVLHCRDLNTTKTHNNKGTLSVYAPFLFLSLVDNYMLWGGLLTDRLDNSGGVCVHITCIYKYMHTLLWYMYSCTYIHTYVRTYIHTYVRTYIHTKIHTHSQQSTYLCAPQILNTPHIFRQGNVFHNCRHPQTFTPPIYQDDVPRDILSYSMYMHAYLHMCVCVCVFIYMQHSWKASPVLQAVRTSTWMRSMIRLQRQRRPCPGWLMPAVKHKIRCNTINLKLHSQRKPTNPYSMV